MGKAAAIPVAIVRGLNPEWFRDGSVRELIRAPKDDLFR
jgi:F420-0:gamma-glutamyl ligase